MDLAKKYEGQKYAFCVEFSVDEVSKQIGKLNLLHDVYLKSLNTTKFVNSVDVCLHVAAAYYLLFSNSRHENAKYEKMSRLVLVYSW